MSYPHILEWSAILIREDIVQFVQRIQTFYDVPKHSVFPIEIFYVVCKCDEKLAAAATFLAVHRGCDSHRHSAFLGVLQLWHDFWGEIPGNGTLILRGRDVRPY